MRRFGGRVQNWIGGIHPIALAEANKVNDGKIKRFLSLCASDPGQDIAEYAVMLAVILVIVVGTIRLIGSHAGNVFSQAASAVQ
jgi:Flp pilus assembly pilin Flp